MMALFERVRDVIARELKVPESKITEDASFESDLAADSLDFVQLIMAFEDEFGIEIPEEDAEKIRTVGDALRYLEEKGATA
ncbi:MAG: acyl carrier protein [Armatimonadetes bacterium]|nr:acyl carrier protein [Armatimonadota bacterium]